jgi:hypothetical protein
MERLDQWLDNEMAEYRINHPWNYPPIPRIPDIYLNLDSLETRLLRLNNPIYTQYKCIKRTCAGSERYALFCDLINDIPPDKQYMHVRIARQIEKDCFKHDDYTHLLYPIGKLMVYSNLSLIDCNSDVTALMTDALLFYLYRIEAVENSICAWMLCAPQLGICKDVARLIGVLVWNKRETW